MAASDYVFIAFQKSLALIGASTDGFGAQSRSFSRRSTTERWTLAPSGMARLAKSGNEAEE